MAGGWALNRFHTRFRTLLIRMAPFALVAFLVALSTLLFLDGRGSDSTLLGVLFATKSRDNVLRPVELLSPIIVLPLSYLAIDWSRGRGSQGVPARVQFSSTEYDDLAGARDGGLLRRFSHVGAAGAKNGPFHDVRDSFPRGPGDRGNLSFGY